MMSPESAPEAKVERRGRWWFRVYVSHGLMQWGPDGYGWFVLGERRAHAKAKAVLRKYIEQERRRTDVQTVTANEAGGSGGAVRNPD